MTPRRRPCSDNNANRIRHRDSRLLYDMESAHPRLKDRSEDFISSLLSLGPISLPECNGLVEIDRVVSTSSAQALPAAISVANERSHYVSAAACTIQKPNLDHVVAPPDKQVRRVPSHRDTSTILMTAGAAAESPQKEDPSLECV